MRFFKRDLTRLFTNRVFLILILLCAGILFGVRHNTTQASSLEAGNESSGVGGGLERGASQAVLSPNFVDTSENKGRSKTDTVSYEPYESERSVAGHVLAFPSYVLHWTTRPVGWGVKYVEENYPYLFKGERAPYGIYPMVELGDEVIGEFGVLLYHNKIGAARHQARMEAMVGVDGSRDYDFSYVIPGVIQQNGNEKLRLDIEYEVDPKEPLYYNSNAEDRRSFYSTVTFEADLVYQFNLWDRHHLSITGGYRNTDIGVSDEEDDEDDFGFFEFPADSTGRTVLGSMGTQVTFDFTKGAKRVTRGGRYIAGISLNKSLTSENPQFLNYHLEWQQFIPLPVLPDDRRFAIRSRMDKSLALKESQIPFYETPDLGGASDLRGFRKYRFRDDGSLLLTLEYRYPIWGFADAVLFMDKGQVFHRYGDIDPLDWHNSYGFGFHLMSGQNFAFRSEFAFSSEFSRVILSISPNF